MADSTIMCDEIIELNDEEEINFNEKNEIC